MNKKKKERLLSVSLFMLVAGTIAVVTALIILLTKGKAFYSLLISGITLYVFSGILNIVINKLNYGKNGIN